jgi:hypothetical protein
MSHALAPGEVSAAILASLGIVSDLINDGAAIKMVAPEGLICPGAPAFGEEKRLSA